MTEYTVTVRFRLPADLEIRSIVDWLVRVISRSGGTHVAVTQFEKQQQNTM